MTPPPPTDTLRQVRREMAKKFHPDQGGSHDAMKAVNVTIDRLDELGTDDS